VWIVAYVRFVTALLRLFPSRAPREPLRPDRNLL